MSVVRWVETHQYITSPVTSRSESAQLRRCRTAACIPNTFTFADPEHDYRSFLPSVNAVYEVADDFQVRAALSRTMTRANPNQMISGVNFSDLTAPSVTLGNPALKPFFSNNIDLGSEYYTGGAGYFGVTAFRKGLCGLHRPARTSPSPSPTWRSSASPTTR